MFLKDVSLKKIFAFIFLFGLSIAGHHAFAASTLNYGTFEGMKGANLIISYDDTQIRNYYSCNIKTFACLPITAHAASGTYFPSVTETTKQLRALKLPGFISEIRIAPSKKYAAYYVYANLTENRLGSFTFMSGTTKYTFPGSTSYWDDIDDGLRPLFDFSPNSSYLAYLDNKSGTPALYLKKTSDISKTSIEGSQITGTSYTVGPFIFGDSNTIYFVANKDSAYLWSLFSYKISTGKITELVKNVSFGNPLHTVGNCIGYLAVKDKAQIPMLYDPATGVSHALLPKGESMPENYNASSNQVVQIGSVKGVLMLPPNFSASTPHPLIIWLHGGPYRQTSNGYDVYLSYAGYDWMLEQARAAGAIVLKLDYTGSFGYGESVGEGLLSKIGISDVHDVENAAKYFPQNNIAVSKTYLVGNSYGGYLALRSIVDKPSLFAGVLSINGVTDWASLLPTVKNSIFDADFNGLPGPNNQSLYDQASILSRIGSLTTQPIFIAQASADRTVNPNQADLLYNALIAAGKNAKIIKYSGEDHVFVKKSSISDLCNQMFTLVSLPIGSNCDFQ